MIKIFAILTSCVVWFSALADAKIDELHTEIDAEQTRIDGLDGNFDGLISLSNRDDANKATLAFIAHVNSAQSALRQYDTEENGKQLKYFLRSLRNDLRAVTNRNKHLVFHYEKKFGQVNGIAGKLGSNHLYAYLQNDLLNAIKNYKYIKHEIIAEDVLLAGINNYPDEVLKNWRIFYREPYAQNIVVTAAKIAPETIKKYFTASSTINNFLIDANDPVIETTLNIFREKGLNTKAYILLDDIVKGNLTIDQAHEYSKDERAYFKKLYEIQGRKQPYGWYSLEHELEYQALKLVRVVNDLHDFPYPKRFASVQGYSAEELYSLIVYSDQEIFTSTFNGFYDDLKKQLNGASGKRLLENVGENRFRTFIKLCAGYGKLDDFLKTMTFSEKEYVLNKFVTELEKNKGDLTQAVYVADTFGSLDDPSLVGVFKESIKREYQRVNDRYDYQGMVIYGLLAKLLVEKKIFYDEWYNDITAQYHLPSIDRLNQYQLFDVNGKHIQWHFFFDDNDGYSSYSTFMSFWRNVNWNIQDKGTYVIIKSANGRQVEIYANKPKDEYAGQDAIKAYFSENGITPHLVVHRGHSYYAYVTIEEVPAGTSMVFLGSCGSYHNITKVIERAPQVHIISAKQIGAMGVNNPILSTIANEVRTNDQILWQPLWDKVEKKVKGNAKSYSQFKDYIPPHKNLGVIFIQAYNNLTSGKS